MSFVSNEEIRAALIARIKATPAVTAHLPSADEVREVEYQGTTFSYPNVRVRLIDNRRFANCYHEVTLGVQVHSEKDSSKEAETISGIIGETLNDVAFSSNNLTFILRITNLVPAMRVDERTWRSEALFTGVVS